MEHNLCSTPGCSRRARCVTGSFCRTCEDTANRRKKEQLVTSLKDRVQELEAEVERLTALLSAEFSLTPSDEFALSLDELLQIDMEATLAAPATVNSFPVPEPVMIPDPTPPRIPHNLGGNFICAAIGNSLP